MGRSVLLIASALMVSRVALGADTVENFDVGLTDFEAGYGAAQGDFAPGHRVGDIGVFVGAGLNGFASVGLGLATDLSAGASPELAIAGFLGAPRDTRLGADLLWEVGYSPLPATIDWSAGVEVDKPGQLITPYGRAVGFGSSGVGFVGVSQEVGAKVSLANDRLQPHLELFTEVTAAGVAPPGVAVGPNWLIVDSTEIIPQLALVPQLGGPPAWEASLNIIHTRTVNAHDLPAATEVVGATQTAEEPP